MSVEIFSSVSQEELQRALQNKLFKGILDTMPNGVQVLKALRNKKNEITDFACVFVNAAAENFAGKKITDKKLSSLLNGEDKHPFFEKLVNVVNTGTTEDFLHYSKDDVQKWFHYTINKFDDGVMITQEDITAQEEAKRETEKKEEQFYSLVENIPDVITRWNKDLQLIYANSAFETKTGIRSENLYGKTNTQMRQPDAIAIPYINSLREAFKTGKTIEHFYSFPTPAGEVYFYSRIVPEKNENGEVETVLTIARDITELKKAEQELKKQHNILKQAEEIAKGGSWEYNINTKEFLWSDGMYELFNMEKGTPVQPSVYSDAAINEDRDIGEKIVNIIEKGFQPFEETLRMKPDGKIKTVRIKGSSFKTKEGKVEKMLGVDMDITQVKEAEDEIKELNKKLYAKNRELEAVNSELRTFSSIAASDYKSTLKNLYTLFEFILTNDAPQLSNSGRANLRRAQSAIQKMKLLTDDVISYSQIQIAEKDITTVDLNEIVDSARQKLEGRIKETGATIELDKLPVIKGYPDLIQLLLYHLLNNAIKFRKEDTRPLIRIIVSQVNGSYVNHADALPERWYNIISISDNGIGFEQKQAEKIFDMFSRLHEQSKYKGSGIGLAICKKVMNIHDGFITVESDPGKGTTFNCFFLPEGPLFSIQP